jgi:hypothetical protein
MQAEILTGTDTTIEEETLTGTDIIMQEETLTETNTTIEEIEEMEREYLKLDDKYHRNSKLCDIGCCIMLLSLLCAIIIMIMGLVVTTATLAVIHEVNKSLLATGFIRSLNFAKSFAVVAAGATILSFVIFIVANASKEKIMDLNQKSIPRRHSFHQRLINYKVQLIEQQVEQQGRSVIDNNHMTDRRIASINETARMFAVLRRPGLLE